ncbi:MAG: sigma-70 family RNA polymerase sigma factor [Vulcanimicrobiaceae bacterium]
MVERASPLADAGPHSGAQALRRPAKRASIEERVAGNRHLCRRGARKFWRAGLERSDLEQVAAVGLIKAARRYDPATGTPFEAYAWILIVGELMHYARDLERTVRVPRAVHELGRRAAVKRMEIAGALGREPSDDELAAALTVAREALAEVRRAQACAQPLPLDDPHALAASESAGCVDPMRALEVRLVVEGALGELPPLQRRVIVGLYLVGLSQHELGRRLGVSRKRVSRAHAAALVTMRARAS